MAAVDGNDVLEIEDEETVNTRHKKERKDLQAQIQKLKHGVPKGDKKKKKEVTEQIAKLEAELDAKHEEELKNLKDRQESDEPSVNGSVQPAETTEAANDEGEVDEETGMPSGGGRKSKAQKRRDKKQAKTKEREDRIKDQEVQNKHGPRQQEMNKIKALLKQRGLALYEIPADGNCMYSAVSHQLASLNIQSTNEELRKKTSEYMRSHRDDFLPFLTHPDTGDMLSPEEFEKYCDKTAKSPVWGGQIELRALSEALRVPIEVVQADTQPLVIGENLEGKPLTLVYHRHVYRLGEHYNSVMLASLCQGEEEAGEEEDSALK